MESALDVLSRAATMVQDSANETRLTTKELPTAKWRRDRRFRTGEYHHILPTTTTASSSTSTYNASPPGSPPPPPPTAVQQQQSEPATTTTAPLDAHTIALVTQNSAISPLPAHSPSHMSRMTATVAMRPLSELTNNPKQLPIVNSTAMHMEDDDDRDDMDDSPLDMTVSSTVIKQKLSPPPPSYKEHLLGHQHHAYGPLLARPSVITQAPPKREALHEGVPQLNCEPESVSMCETVIDEHFRRSLGADYVALFGKKSPVASTSPQSQHGSSPLAKAAPLPSSHHALSLAQTAMPSRNPSTMLLSSPTSAAHKTEQLSAAAEFEQPPPVPATNFSLSALPPPQDEPLSLHRASTTPALAAAKTIAEPQSQLQPLVLTTASIAKAQSSASPPQVVSSAAALAANTKFVNAHSPSPPPYRQSPSIAIGNASAAATKANAVSSTSASAGVAAEMLPTIGRVKHETNSANHHHHITAANTPPASPNSISNASISTSSSDVLASVDDHFAKALGDTWKKLQQSKELRK